MEIEKVTVGQFTVSAGKGDRIYVSHPDEMTDYRQPPHGEMTSLNGTLIYGFDAAKDLAAAIIALDRLMCRNDSVERRAELAVQVIADAPEVKAQ